MQIIKIMIMSLCIILAGMAFYYHLKTRRLLNDNSDDELNKIMPKIQSLTKQLSVVLYVLAAIFAIYIVVLIVEFVLKIL